MAKLIGIFLFLGIIASAQQTGISGRVTDPSGAFIVSARIVATGEDGSKI